MKTYQWLAGCLIAGSMPLQAANLFQPMELNDHELSQLRGRYVLPDRIVSFGVTMSSSWQNANGQVLGGQLNMQIQQGLAKPVFNVTTFNGSGQATQAGSGQLIGGEGLNQVQGVVQSTRSAGDFNVSQNGINIDVTHGTQAPLAEGQNSLANTIQTSDLGVVRINSGNGGLQLAINANGQGSSLQQLGAGGAVQRTDIVGSNNRVENVAALNVMLRENMPSASGLNCAWEQLKSLQPTGY
ncbi:hypothetical protein NVV93_09165 [Pseudomonas sp. LS44]|uniref:hypothetical protein n=1 Tax=Pseudomonas sp. LS44 TaxID=1357074 RepID=UPI00215B32DE|nr:hypothetical protein [Pseudomonas sp. LS44]UVE19518.1 hypothetical protein NVV93_09165 [Pseudomonas sp. LS44]